MQQDIINANAKVEQVGELLAEYVQNCGCINMSMRDLRDAFAKIYNPKAPEFHYHFSALARTAIAEDARRGRIPYPVGGTMSADYDVMEGNPVILPGKAVFHDSKESFARTLSRIAASQRE